MQEGILAAAHQIEANLLESLADRARYRLRTDPRDQGLGQGVDLGHRSADPERLLEQNRGEEARVFLVTPVERLIDGFAELAQAVVDWVSPVADESQVIEQRLRAGVPELLLLGEQQANLAEALAAGVVTSEDQQQAATGKHRR